VTEYGGVHPIIPGTEEVEIGGLQFKASPGKKKLVRPYFKNKTKLEKVVHAYNPTIPDVEIGRSQSEVWPRQKHNTLSEKENQKGTAQVVEHLPRKCEFKPSHTHTHTHPSTTHTHTHTEYPFRNKEKPMCRNSYRC
jgi:hypothetical protein